MKLHINVLLCESVRNWNIVEGIKDDSMNKKNIPKENKNKLVILYNNILLW